MRITSKAGASLTIGTFEKFENNAITLNGVDGNTYEYPMTEKSAENFGKCNVEKGTFLSVYVAEDKVENFKFKGKQRLIVERKKKESEDSYTTEVNIFIGKAARVAELPKSVQVSIPVQKKEGTEWFALNFWKGEGEMNLGDKALLELQAPEGEVKPNFWAITGGPRKYKDKNGNDRASYTVNTFGVINN